MGRAALACSAVCTPTSDSGVPDGTTGSVFLVDKAYYQTTRITCSATLTTGCDNAGIVFSYRDRLNFWVRVYSLASQTARVYEVSAGAWTQRDSTSFAITSGVAFTMDSDVRAGGTDGYAATIPAGQVGLWVSDASNNSFDNFKAHDLAGPFEVDGRWFSNSGDVQVDASNSNLIAIGTASDKQVTVVRRGFRAGKYVLTYRFQWISGTRTGPLVRWVNPGDWIAVQLFHSDGKARLSKREADGNVTQLVTGTNTVSLTNNNWYTGKVVVGDDLGNSALQRLRFWVDSDDDGDWSDETALLDTTTIDDVWSAGHVGLFRGSVSNAQSFDDFEAGIDANADLDLADGGDEVVVDDDFSTSIVTLASDYAGLLTDDGIQKYTYDAWYRLRTIKHRSAANASTIASYMYDGEHRRLSRTVTNRGIEHRFADGGNTSIRYFHDRAARPVEERNGSGQTVRHAVFGKINVDELIFAEANGVPASNEDTNPNNTASGESSEDPVDVRRFSVLNDVWSVVGMSAYDVGGSTNGRIHERRTYSAYGDPTTFGNSTVDEALSTLHVSAAGEATAFFGVRRDPESLLVHDRGRDYQPHLGLFHEPETADQVPQGSTTYTPSIHYPPLYSRYFPQGEATLSDLHTWTCTSRCCHRWRRARVVWILASHLGWDLRLTYSGVTEYKYVDFGFLPSSPNNCGWSVFRRAYDSPQDGAFGMELSGRERDVPYSVCELATYGWPYEIPWQWGRCGNYNAYPGPNSNTGIGLAREWVQIYGGYSIPLPAWAWINTAPGWGWGLRIEDGNYSCCTGYNYFPYYCDSCSSTSP